MVTWHTTTGPGKEKTLPISHQGDWFIGHDGKPYVAGTSYPAGHSTGYTEKVTTEKTVERHNPASAVIPEDVTILRDRAGQADRDKVTAHLEDAHAKGYLSTDEADRRLGHARDAETKAQLTALISDLPTGRENRAGDADRDKVTDHIHNMYIAGYINQEDRDKRVTAAQNAVTKDELVPLTADLPPFPAPKRAPKEPDRTLRDQLTTRSPVVGILIAVCAALSATFVAGPWILLGGSGHPFQYVLAVLSTIAGVFGIIGSLAWGDATFSDPSASKK